MTEEVSSCYCDFVSTCTLSSSSAIYVGLGIHIPSSVPELKDASPGVRFAMASVYTLSISISTTTAHPGP
jgi:hypothetical protein